MFILFTREISDFFILEMFADAEFVRDFRVVATANLDFGIQVISRTMPGESKKLKRSVNSEWCFGVKPADFWNRFHEYGIHFATWEWKGRECNLRSLYAADWG